MYLIRKLFRGDELRDDELLMILIGTADKARSAAWDLVKKGGLTKFVDEASPDKLTAFEGLGETKVGRLMAVAEIARRVREEDRERDRRSRSSRTIPLWSNSVELVLDRSVAKIALRYADADPPRRKGRR